MLVARLFSLAAVVALATTAHADPLKCQRGILKESGKYRAGEHEGPQQMRGSKIKGKLPGVTVCTTEEKTAAALPRPTTSASRESPSPAAAPTRPAGRRGDDDLDGPDLMAASRVPISRAWAAPTRSATATTSLTVSRASTTEAIEQAIGLYYGSLPLAETCSEVPDRDRQGDGGILCVEDEGPRQVLGRASQRQAQQPCARSW